MPAAAERQLCGLAGEGLVGIGLGTVEVEAIGIGLNEGDGPGPGGVSLVHGQAEEPRHDVKRIQHSAKKLRGMKASAHQHHASGRAPVSGIEPQQVQTRRKSPSALAQTGPLDVVAAGCESVSVGQRANQAPVDVEDP